MKGLESQRNSLKRAYLIRIGKIKPIEYSMTVEEAIKAAGIKEMNDNDRSIRN